MKTRRFRHWGPGLLLALLGLAAGCRSVPYTDRTQLMLTDEAEEAALGAQAFNQFRAQYRASTNANQIAALNRVAEALKTAANRPHFAWEFVVLEAPEANAFCLPGGKVAVLSGLFRYTANDAELATVVSHEIAHALARHGGEQRSWEGLRTLGLGTLTAAGYNSDTVAALYGITTELAVARPFSREHEYEADRIGLYLLAEAGYRPDAAISFWKKFGTGGTRVSEWFSTHPNGLNRLSELEELLPEATERYYRAPVKRGSGQVILP